MPVAGDRLKHRQRCERSGVGAQHPRSQPDAGNKSEFAQRIKLAFGKAAFGAGEQRRRGWVKLYHSVSDRDPGAGLVADKEPAFMPPPGENRFERLGGMQLRH